MILSDLIIWHCSLDPPGLSLCWCRTRLIPCSSLSLRLVLYSWIQSLNQWQCPMKPFILQSKEHHYSRKKTCTPRPLSPFRLWHFLDDHLLDPKLIQDLPLSGRIQLPKVAELPSPEQVLSSIMCGVCDPDSHICSEVFFFWCFLGELHPHKWKSWESAAHNGWRKSWSGGDGWQKIS